LTLKILRVTAAPSEIIIQAACEPRKPTEDATILWSEFGSPDLCRRFELPGLIDTNRVSAKLANGVLTLSIPKEEPAKPQKITRAAA
jgi:HSP20 family molecular chaperone IbpA